MFTAGCESFVWENGTLLNRSNHKAKEARLINSNSLVSPNSRAMDKVKHTKSQTKSKVTKKVQKRLYIPWAGSIPRSLKDM